MTQRAILSASDGIWPDVAPVSTLTERDCACLCTWVIAEWKPHGLATFRMKYRNAYCPVYGHAMG